MPTVAGQRYYIKVLSTSSRPPGVLRLMDPRPDFSDPMPAGCLYLGNASTVTPYPDQDLGLIINCDDDGLLTNIYLRRQSGTPINGVSVGQTFIARGVGLISAAFWIADPAAPAYLFKVFRDGPGPAQVQIGTAKRGKPARVTADPQVLVTWAPGECPLTPGEKYYVEITRPGGESVNSVWINNQSPFPGEGHRNGEAGLFDLVCTIMEEESAGSATKPAIRFVNEPAFTDADIGADSLTIRWTTDQPATSQLQFAAWTPPYTGFASNDALATNHSVTLSNLNPHTLYHFRALSSHASARSALSRDMVVCTKPATANLLVNPGFENGSGASPRKPVPGWTKTGNVDVGAADGTWFYSLKPRTGRWLLQGAVNGSSSDGGVYQRLPANPGSSYTFSAWITTWPRENSTFKYDVWNAENRLIYMRLGIDPTGGTNPAASTVQWMPRVYSHLRYSNVAKTAVARGTNLTVFISMKGDGVEWHLYGVDDAIVTEEPAAPLQLMNPSLQDGVFQAMLSGPLNTAVTIDYSTNLLQWLPLTNVQIQNGPVLFQTSSGPQNRFYRARR